MFGQNDDQQSQDTNSFGQTAQPSFDAPTQAPGAPAGPIDQTATPEPSTDLFDNPMPAVDDSVPAEIADVPVTTSSTTASLPSDDLLEIKQDALQELSPLVGHLEQSPEERFRTTMMMIQASDDHSLIKSAYDAAKQITDEKARAQALLDVVNEINYFTQQHN